MKGDRSQHGSSLRRWPAWWPCRSVGGDAGSPPRPPPGRDRTGLPAPQPAHSSEPAMAEQHPVRIGSTRVTTDDGTTVSSPYDGHEIGIIPACDSDHVDRAV